MSFLETGVNGGNPNAAVKNAYFSLDLIEGGLIVDFCDFLS